MTLLPVDDALWIAEGPTVDFFGFPYPTRMAVVRLRCGGLWIWSPIALDPPLRDGIERLGPVRYLVSPNKLHHLYLRDWLDAFEGSRLWALPSLKAKRPDLPYAGDLGDSAAPEWRDEIDQAVFRGSVFMDECVFHHRASRTAIFADLIENFSEDFLTRTPGWTGWKRVVARLWHITEPCGMAPLEWRLSFVNRTAARKALDTVIDWNPERVVMAHGVWVREDGRRFVERSFRWLKRPGEAASP